MCINFVRYFDFSLQTIINYFILLKNLYNKITKWEDMFHQEPFFFFKSKEI